MPSLRGHEPAIWAAAVMEMMERGFDAYTAAERATEQVLALRAVDCDRLEPEAAAMLREMLGEGEEVPSEEATCSNCAGGGEVYEKERDPYKRWVTCPTCHGTGQPGEKKSQTDGYFDLIRGTVQPDESEE
jgi:hypothetical protein